MMTVSITEKTTSLLSCQIFQKNYEAEIVKVKHIKTAGIVITIAGTFLALLGLILFIFSGSVVPTVSVALMSIGTIILICGLVLSIVFYRRLSVLHKTGSFLKVSVQMEGLLKEIKQNLRDLRNKIEVLSLESPRFKERLNFVSCTVLDRLVESHCKLSENVYKAIQSGMFGEKETLDSLQGELSSLYENCASCSETVLRNLQLHEHIKTVEAQCQKALPEQVDTDIVLQPFMDYQENVLSLSEMILKTEPLNSSEVLGYRKDLEKLFDKEIITYDFVIDQMATLNCLQGVGGWRTLRENYNSVINKTMIITDYLLYQSLVKKVEKIDAVFEDVDGRTESFLQDRLKNLFSLKNDICSCVKELPKGYPPGGGMKEIEEFYSESVSVIQFSKKYDESSVQGLSSNIDVKILDGTLELLSVLARDRQDIPLCDLLQQTLKNNGDLLKNEISEYLALLTDLTPLIVNLTHLSGIGNWGQRVALIQKLQIQSNYFAESQEVSLTEEMRISENERLLLNKCRLVFEQISKKQESYLCKQGIRDGLHKLIHRLEIESSKESSVVLDEFLQDIEERKVHAAGIYKKHWTDSEKNKNETVMRLGRVEELLEQTNIFFELVPLLEKHSELENISRKQTWFSSKRSIINASLKEIECEIRRHLSVNRNPLQREFIERVKDYGECWLNGMGVVRSYYTELYSLLYEINLRLVLASYRSLLCVFKVEEPPSQEICRRLMGKLNKILARINKVEESSSKLGLKKLSKESGDMRRILEDTKISFVAALENTFESYNRASAGEVSGRAEE